MATTDSKRSTSRSTTPHRIFAVVRERIINGTYAPGQRLTEQSFADEFQASRTPVREAMRLLAADGYVDFKPNSGTVVRSWSAEQLVEIFMLRAQLEAEICGYAAERMRPEQVEQLVALQDEIEAQGADISEANRTRVSQLNRVFHQHIADASGQERMVALLARAIEVPVVQRTFGSYDARQMQRSFYQHRELIDAFAANDRDWAVSVMRCHVLAAKNAILQAMLRQQEPQR